MKTLSTKFKMRKMSTSISLQDHMLSTSCMMMNFSWFHLVTQFPWTEPGIVEISVTFSPKMDLRYRMVKTYGPTQWKNESKTGNLFILHKESVHFVIKKKSHECHTMKYGSLCMQAVANYHHHSNGNTLTFSGAKVFIDFYNTARSSWESWLDLSTSLLEGKMSWFCSAVVGMDEGWKIWARRWSTSWILSVCWYVSSGRFTWGNQKQEILNIEGKSKMRMILPINVIEGIY